MSTSISKLFFSFSLIVAVSSASADIFNTNPLIERGIDPHILNLSVTPFKQQIAYKAETVYYEETDGKRSTHSVNILFDPYKNYGIDIRMQVPKDELQYYYESQIISRLDRTMGLQSYLQSERLYDRNSIRYVGEEDGMEKVFFRLDPDAIPREIKQYKNFEGHVYIKDGALYMMEVTNTEPFREDGIDVEHFSKEIYFAKLKDHKVYLPQKTVVKIVGRKNGKPYKAEAVTHVVAYWDEKKQPIYFEGMDAVHSKDVDERAYKTFYVNLDRTLPLLGQEARKEGYDLPKAYGLSLITMMQNTRFYMTSFEVDGKDLSKYFDKTSKYENTTMISMVQFDTWILPFLNVGVMVGGSDTATDLTLDTSNRCLAGIKAADGSCLISDTGGKSISVDPFKTNSILYGVGTTLGGGVGDFFGTINLQYMTSYTKSADVKTEILVITPVFGYYFKEYGVRVMGGGMYEDLKEYLDFDLTEAGKPKLKGTIGLGAEKWAATFGVNYDFTRHWTGNILMAYGEDFQNLNFVVGYRW